MLNKGDYTFAKRIENTLKFMNHSNKDFEKAFNSLDYNDYYKTRDNKQYDSRIYVFNKNDPQTGNLYVKFSLNKELKDLNILSYNNDEIVHEETKHIPTISALVKNPNFLDLIGRSVDKALSIIKNKVENHQYSKAYRANRSIKELRYQRKEFRDIVSKLEKKHYISGPDVVYLNAAMDNIDGTVWVFGYNDETKENELYIKFLIDTSQNEIKVLSFHLTDRPLNFFFEELQ